MGHPNRGRGARRSSAHKALGIIRDEIAAGFSIQIPGVEFRVGAGRSEDRLKSSGSATLSVAGVEVTAGLSITKPEQFKPDRVELPNGDCMLRILPDLAFIGSVRRSDVVARQCDIPIELAL